MNIAKLYEMQKTLDERIIKEKGLEGQDLLPNTVLALQVEIAELANEWRGFKHWSNDQDPRYERKCHACEGVGGFVGGSFEEHLMCLYCEGSGVEERPLLEEYVDCLHFFLSIARQLDISNDELELPDEELTGETAIIFIELLNHVGGIILIDNTQEARKIFLIVVLAMFICFGKQRLGFTWEQIAQAYMDKNKVNHERQTNGY